MHSEISKEKIYKEKHPFWNSENPREGENLSYKIRLTEI